MTGMGGGRSSARVGTRDMGRSSPVTGERERETREREEAEDGRPISTGSFVGAGIGSGCAGR
jgi:hypothetical protein